MADPTNYEQFNANVTELVKVVQDALKAAYGLESVSHGQALGLLAGIDDLASAPVGSASTLRDRIEALTKGDYGLGIESGNFFLDGADTGSTVFPNGFHRYDSRYQSGGNPWPSEFVGGLIQTRTADNATQQILIGRGRVWFRDIRVDQADTKEWKILYGANNTTIDSNGFLKSASPIVRLANDASCAQGAGFTDAGAGTCNGAANGVSAEHVGTGVYEVSGSLGLAAEGWQIELPQEPGTGQHLIMAKTEWDADAAVLTVRTFNRQFDVNTASIVPGDPTDIPDGRWLDLRLEMPEPETPEEETTP